MCPKLLEDYRVKYQALTEARRKAIRQLKKGATKLEQEEDSDDDMYTRNIQIKERAQYDILM